jgi:hypothetical protein
MSGARLWPALGATLLSCLCAGGAHAADDAYVVVRLADGSAVRVLVGPDPTLRHLRRPHDRGEPTPADSAPGGRPTRGDVPDDPGRIPEIHTPGAIASVRGRRGARHRSQRHGRTRAA